MSDGGHGGHKRRGGHEEEHEEHENHERWLVSYADMMTLLMVLFIVMFAISQVDLKKFMALKTGLAAGFGAPVDFLSGADNMLDAGGEILPDSPNLNGTAGANGSKGKEVTKEQKSASASAASVNPEKVAELATAMQQASVKAEVKNLKQAQKQLEAALKKAGLNKGATFRFDERGLIVSIATDDVLFDSGEATLKPGGRRILNALAPTLRKLPNQLSIDGHTNNIPISTARFPSNWELSTDRATGVLRYLASTQKVPWTRMSATGFADTHPLLDPSNPRSLTVNRRVEIVVLARVDDSAGRAVATLGNAKSTDPRADTATVDTSDTSSTDASGDGSTDGTDENPSPSPSESHLSLLAPTATPTPTTAEATPTKAEATPTKATATKATKSRSSGKHAG